MMSAIEQLTRRRDLLSSLRQWRRDPEITRRLTRLADGLFWFLVLVSWLPLGAGFQDVVSQLNPWTWWTTIAGRALAIPKFEWFLALSVLMLGLGAFRSRWNILCIPPVLCATFLAAYNEGNATALPASSMTAAYIAAVVASAGVFIWRARLRSIYCGLFVVLALVEIVSGLISNTPILTFGHLFKSYTFSGLDLLFLAVIVGALRFVALVFRDNASFVKSVWGWSLAKDILRAALLWWPMLAIFLVMSAFYSHVEGKLSDSVASTLVEGIDLKKVPRPAGSPELKPENIALPQAIDISVAHGADQITNSTKELTAKLKISAATKADQLSGEVRNQIHGSFPDRIMEPASCSWYDIFCHVMNGIKSAVNSIYRRVRDLLLRELDQEIASIDSRVKNEADARVQQINKAVQDASARVAKSTELATQKFFETLNEISLLLLIYSFLILLKTYLIVLARVIFRDDPDGKIGRVGPGNVPRSRSPIQPLDQEFEIRASDNINYYVAFEFELRNNVPRTVWPKFATSPVGRIVSRRYRLGLVDVEAPNFTDATIVVNSPAEFVVWTLRPGEEVIFRYRDLAAFSTDIRLATEIKFSIAALVFGRAIFHKAVGPGILVFKTVGAAVAGRVRDANESRRSSSLKAWHIDNGFRIQSALTVIDTFLSPYNIRKETLDNVVYDTAPQNGRLTTLGILGYMRVFLLPF
jgi:hypothetical protein